VQGVLRERCQWEVPERDVARALASP
jgi:hypothetical protein